MKKGFTLIELLGVVVILAILILLAAPQILKIITNTQKNAFAVETVAVIKAAENAYSSGNIKEKYTLDDLADYIDIKDNYTGEINVDSSKEKPIFTVTLKNEKFIVLNMTKEEINAETVLYNESLIAKIIDFGAGDNGTFAYKNNSNRFIGADPNNWLEFGKDSSDNVLMWRIVKHDNQGVQVIFEGVKQGLNPPAGDGRITIESSTTAAYDTGNTNNWERPASLKTKLNTWYNSLQLNTNLIKPINWCLGASGEGIGHPIDQVPTNHFLETECVDAAYSGGNFLGVTNETSSVGLIRASDFFNSSSAATCTGGYYYGDGSWEVDGGRHCGRIVDSETVRTNYLWKEEYHWWTSTAFAKNSNHIWRISDSGYVSETYVTNASIAVRPVINLSNNIIYESGTGTLSDPYKIS